MDKRSLYIFLKFIALSLAKEDDVNKLPLCPTNIEYFPQNLPMHCRMPRSADDGNSPPGMPPGSPPLPPPFYQGPPSDKHPSPIPIPIPPGGPVPYPFPGGPSGASFAMSMPMSVPLPGPAHKLPVIVMPFYSPDPAYKKPSRPDELKPRHAHKRPRRPRHRPRRPRPHYSDTDTDSSTDTDTDTDTDSSETDASSDTSSDTSSDSSNERRSWFHPHSGRGNPKRSGRRSAKKHSHKSKRRHNKMKEDLLTPVLQYVTKDGYVIFEKKISRGEAKDWLRMRSDDADPNKETIVDAANAKGASDNENAEYKDKSEEKAKDEATVTEKVHQKYPKIKPNNLLTSNADNAT